MRSRRATITLRVFEYLESARNFYYRNCGNLAFDESKGRSQDAIREELRKQIASAEVIIALSSLYSEQQDLLIFQLHYAKASDKPVVFLPLVRSRAAQAQDARWAAR